MDRRDQETSGDYGYDLVHEEMGTPRVPGGRVGGQQGARQADGGEAALDGDLGYDEAHDL